MYEDKIDKIKSLPTDVQKRIYSEYVKQYLILTELNDILNSEPSKSLDPKPLYYFLKKSIIDNKQIIKYLNENNKIFKLIYDEHIIRCIKTFKKIDDEVESLALSWLMHLYH